MNKKLLGEERRNKVLQWLKEAKSPLSGNSLAKRANVSRQVVVGDITLLKAKNEPIMATAQGYVYMHPDNGSNKIQKVIICRHSNTETKKELEILVDHGITVKDVMVEHPVYGYITAQLQITNRYDISIFLQKMEETNSVPLANLTNGIHLHTIEADNDQQLENALSELKKEGILIDMSS
ncbi:transcription repressor NadR [Gottfriedia solisilvae]|uniref:Transcriptional regulator n=1 Tax=Gottfriedia solisilvae TaxID=1516104 RepID=A0A8J3AEG3_9BACI|nr:transcription repressor NadR [Gottfriedia solisilvae]GGI10516.1 transcriptional regulator [Gottfriedia solisilvae]